MDLTRLASLFPADRVLPESVPDDVTALESLIGGTTLDGGLFRWFDADTRRRWAALALEAFPALAGRIYPFGADWLGCQFALDNHRLDNAGQPQVLLLDVGAGELLEVPATLRAFHEEELIDHHDAALASTFYKQWRTRSADPQPLGMSECVGYSVPLFLGGGDVLDNLARTDADVYWTLTGQLLTHVGPSS